MADRSIVEQNLIDAIALKLALWEPKEEGDRLEQLMNDGQMIVTRTDADVIEVFIGPTLILEVPLVALTRTEEPNFN